jgi:hypothetical protein
VTVSCLTNDVPFRRLRLLILRSRCCVHPTRSALAAVARPLVVAVVVVVRRTQHGMGLLMVPIDDGALGHRWSAHVEHDDPRPLSLTLPAGCTFLPFVPSHLSHVTSL